jgi:hypothetical protein
VAEPDGWEAQLGGLAIAEGILTGSREITQGCLFSLGAIDRGEGSCSSQAGQWHSVSAVRFDPITGLVGNE